MVTFSFNFNKWFLWKRLTFFRSAFFYGFGICGVVGGVFAACLFSGCGNIYNGEIWGSSNGDYGYETVYFELPEWAGGAEGPVKWGGPEGGKATVRGVEGTEGGVEGTVVSTQGPEVWDGGTVVRGGAVESAEVAENAGISEGGKAAVGNGAPRKAKSAEVAETKLLPPLAFWEVKVSGIDYSKTFRVGRDVSIIPLLVRKNEPLSILAYPVNKFSAGNKNWNENQNMYDNGSEPDAGNKKEGDDFIYSQFFKPAGTVYPYSERKLSWERGFSAYIMAALWNIRNESSLSDNKINDFIASFNWKKFQESIDKKIEDSISYYRETADTDGFCSGKTIKPFYNPWQCNIQILLENLSFGQFKASLLTPKSVYAVNGDFLSPKPFYSSFIPENLIIQKYGFCSVQKNALNDFLCGNNRIACINYVSPKNISVSYIQLPIYISEL